MSDPQKQTVSPDASLDTSYEKISKELLDDTSQLQKAFEKVADEATSGIPPLPSIPSDEDTDPVRSTGQPVSAPPGVSPDDPVSSWFFTFMCMNIPIIGWVYLIWLAFNKKTTRRRNFARAYLFYKLIFLGIAVILIGILTWICLDLLDQLLAYMEML